MKHTEQVKEIGLNALNASRKLALLKSTDKNRILIAMADALDADCEFLKTENAKDMEAGKEDGLSAAMLDRLLLTDDRIKGMSQGLRDIAKLRDPVGTVISTVDRPNGLEIKKIRVPIGVIAIIYESRPNVTADAAALCFKTSNAVILRGGKEAAYSNRAIVQVMLAAGEKAGLPINAIQLLDIPGHDAVRDLVQLEDIINLVIPRGGERLIRMVTENAHVPVIKHYKGVCHTFIDQSADLEMALNITENAKCQRPGVCNAIETLLVHRAIAPSVLPTIIEMLKKQNVEIRGDAETFAMAPDIKPAVDEDWDAEYLDMILAVKIVDDAQAAIDHINKHGSGHSDAIITQDTESAESFINQVDSATVYVNASTRFTDGGEFGMGAEIGISTDKLHARGPMGLEELCTYKFVIGGTGQVRS
ncbi:MAG: glutamate-5-semialdehyde dehydrogenase [Lentisphaerae bacterium]|nr:glutamate-5-semialdehyde dehydrogenase [Lentisphaerota bacterium]